LNGRHYTALKVFKYAQQDGICALPGCNQTMDPSNTHLHHINGRGMGGGKRDDRPETTELMHPICHMEGKHG